MQKFYKGNTVLVTDDYGKKLLIDKLKLPYDEVIVELDILNNAHKGLWALGKIYTYSLIKQPFIHIDLDFFLADKFDSRITNANLVSYVSEHSDSRQSYYQPILNDYFDKLSLPSELDFYVKQRNRIAYNAGIIGGEYWQIFDELWYLTAETVSRNKDKIDTYLVNGYVETGFNMILEQYAYACLAHEKGLNVECLEDEKYVAENLNYPIDNIQYYPQNHIHMLGNAKRNLKNAISIEEILKVEGYEYYRLIQELIRYNQI